MNTRVDNNNYSVKNIREVFTFIVNSKMFKTTATKGQFLKALEYVNLINTDDKLRTLKAVLEAGGFYVVIQEETIHDTFTI